MWDSARNMFKELCNGANFDSISDVLTFNPSTELSSAWSAAYTIYDTLMVPAALGLMIIWFLVKMMERSSNEQMTIEQFFMLFVKLIAAKFLIDNGFDLFAQMWGLGISLVNSASSAFSTGSAAVMDHEALWKEFTGYDWDDKINFIKVIPYWAQLLLPWLVGKIIIACVYFIAYSRLIEMLVRVCGTPVALSDFMNEGLHGAGWRWMKTFLAICLQGMLILIISRIYSLIMADVFAAAPTTDWWDNILKQIAISFAAIAIMFKSLSLSRELLGV